MFLHITGSLASSPASAICFSTALAIRVVFAEDNYLVREGVRRLLDTVADIELVRVCEGVDELREAIDADEPHVVLTDIRMPPTGTDEGIRVADQLRDSHPQIGVVVLSQFRDPQYALALLDRGASGRAYLLKERVRDLEQLVGAIREIAAGGSVIDPAVVEALVTQRLQAQASPLGDLTPRELQTLGEMAQGKSNAAIAESLVITEHSVEKIIHSIFLKLGLTWQSDINRRVKAVLVYLSEQGLPPETTTAP